MAGKKLATGITKLDDGRIRVVARNFSPSITKRKVLPADTPLSQAVAIRESMLSSMKGETKVQPGSLITCGDVLRTYDREKRSWGDAYYNRLLKHMDNVPLYGAWGALISFVELMRKQVHAQGKSFSPATINRHITIAKAAMNYCYEKRCGSNWQRLIPENYLSGFKVLKENNINYRTLSIEDRAKFWDALPYYLKPLYYFACRIPARVNELVNLTQENVNRFSGFITLPDGSTKNGMGRQLKIPEEFRDYVDEFILSGSKYLFHKDGQPLGYWYYASEKIKFNYRKSWSSACKAAGIEGYNFHKTRQEAVLHLYQEGWGIEEIMILGGWQSREAFDRYFPRDVALMVKNGTHQIDLEWYGEFAKVWKKAA
jgi:integrase